MRQVLFNIVLEDMVSAIRQDKGKKYSYWKERKKPSLFTDNMTVYIENPMESINKVLAN